MARNEEKYNVKIVNTSTWDETAWFIGGHADLVSPADIRDAAHPENTGKDLTAFGKNNLMRNTIFVKADSPYKTIEDLKGKKIAVSGGGAAVVCGRAIILKKYGLDLKLGGGDFKCNVQEFQAMPISLDKGDVDACVGLIDYEIPYMVNGTHRWLWPDQPTMELLRENFDPDKQHIGVMMNLMVGQKEWVDKNPTLAEGFLMMWQVGVNEYWADKQASILAYPDLYTVQNDKELQWFLSYLETHDSCVTSTTWTRPGSRRRRRSSSSASIPVLFRRSHRCRCSRPWPRLPTLPTRPCLRRRRRTRSNGSFELKSLSVSRGRSGCAASTALRPRSAATVRPSSSTVCNPPGA